MKFKSLFLLTAATLAADAAQAGNREDTVRLIIERKQGVAQSLSDSSEFSNIKPTIDPMIKTLTVEKGQEQAVAELLKKNDAIENVEFDAITENPFFIPKEQNDQSNHAQYSPNEPNDTEYPRQNAWKEWSSSFAGRMELFEGARLSQENKKLRIGILDSEFHLHSDIDWGVGYNFSTNNNDKVGPEFLEDYYDPSCPGAHGSAVAHILGAKTNNSLGIAGSVNATIHPVRVMSCGRGYTLDLASGIRWLARDTTLGVSTVIDEPVDIMNISMGSLTGYCPSYLQNAIDFAYHKGIAIFVSAGNNNDNVDRYAPAGCKNVFTVGSVNLYGDRSRFTNYGDKVDVSGLGEDVRSVSKQGYLHWSGTSFSAPNSAAIGAQALQAAPDLSPDELFNYLRKNTHPYYYDYSDQPIGSGVVSGKLVLRSLNKDKKLDIPILKTSLSYIERSNTDAYKAATYIDDNGNTIKPCHIFEIDSSKALPPSDSTYAYRTLFSVSQGDALTLNNAEKITATTQPRFIEHNLNPDVFDYGFGFCNETGSQCASDTLTPLNDDQINPRQWCEPQMDI